MSSPHIEAPQEKEFSGYIISKPTTIEKHAPEPIVVEKAVEKLVPVPVERIVHKPYPVPIPIPQVNFYKTRLINSIIYNKFPRVYMLLPHIFVNYFIEINLFYF